MTQRDSPTSLPSLQDEQLLSASETEEVPLRAKKRVVLRRSARKNGVPRGVNWVIPKRMDVLAIKKSLSVARPPRRRMLGDWIGGRNCLLGLRAPKQVLFDSNPM